MLHIFSGEAMLVWDEIDTKLTNHQYILCFVVQKLRSEPIFIQVWAEMISF